MTPTTATASRWPTRTRERARAGRAAAAEEGEADAVAVAAVASESGDEGADEHVGGGARPPSRTLPSRTARPRTAPTRSRPARAGTRRRRRRRRKASGEADSGEADTDDPPNTVVRVREPRKRAGRETSRDTASDDDGVRSVKGSTRLEAKKQRRREGREAGRRRPSIITEAEFLARRESVDRSMIVRQAGERTQIAVLEDGVLVEHYVSTASSSGLVGNVYLGKVQNVLPSMEAAFVDVGKGRNAVLYAGEVNWDAAGLDGQPRRIELALKSGDPVLVQVTKDPIGHKGARLTSQVSLAGRYLVLVPGGSMTGISRKLPDTERSRLKAILKKVVPEGAGVIVRTAAEGASEEELAPRRGAPHRAVGGHREEVRQGSAAPALLYGEPDMTIRVVRDIFNEDFASLVVSGDDAWDMLEPYVAHVAPDLRERMSRWTDEQDVFSAHTASTSSSPRRWTARSGCPAAATSSSTAPRRWSWSTSTPGSSPERAATSRRPSPRTTSRRPRRSSASSGCATSAASSSSTSSTWCSRATATSSCAACSSASAGTGPSTRSPRSPRSGSSR